MSGNTKFASWDANTDGKSSGEDLLAPGASCCTGRVVDILSLKRRVPAFTLDCTDAFHQAPEMDDVMLEPPGEYLNRLRTAGMCTSFW